MGFGGSNEQHEVDHEQKTHHGLPLSPELTGYLVCGLSCAEGLYLIFAGGPVGILQNENSPFNDALRFFLAVCGWGDLLVGAFLGGLGLWLSHNLLPKFLNDSLNLSRNLDSVSSSLVALMFCWRALVFVAVAPWAGMALAFAPETYNKTMFLQNISVYLFVSMYLLWQMLAVYPATLDAAIETKKTLMLNNPQIGIGSFQGGAAERQLLIEGTEQNPRVWSDIDKIFGVVPLEPAVWAYSYGVCIFSLWMLTTGRSGAWAQIVGGKGVNVTRTTEFLCLVCTFIASFCGAAAITFYRDRRRMPTFDKRSTSAVLVFFVFNLLRVTLCLPITVMSLVSMNICGFYVRGLAVVGSFWSGFFGKTNSCSDDDITKLIIVLGVASADAYMAWCVFRLWRQYRFARPLDARKLRGIEEDYGAAMADGPVHEM